MELTFLEYSRGIFDVMKVPRVSSTFFSRSCGCCEKSRVLSMKQAHVNYSDGVQVDSQKHSFKQREGHV